MEDKDLQVQEKQELKTKSESTRNVPIYIPPVDIFESPSELVLMADMPGVAFDNVDIDLDNDQLTIRGSVRVEDEKGTVLLKEYSVGDYYRQFTLSNVIDRNKIEASMKDGVLKVVLPKAEAAKPRKITVKST
ncbi:MAG TPA: Hsp20/alpha crystallin family protein [Syntrophobacteraceae bacterium]|nr:Hsp20/alpha crystallin family protein [Syntrophobacteraceae bacterium]